MKKIVTLSVIMLMVALLTVGCVSQETYDALMAEYNNAQAEVTSLTGDLATEQDKSAKLESDLSAEQSKTTKLEGDLATEQGKTAKLEGDLATEQGKSAKLGSDLMAANSRASSLQSDLSEVQSKLTEINKVYPPRHFSSMNELHDWLVSNDVSDRSGSTTAEDVYAKALDIQEDALQDGYIVSAWIDYYAEEEMFYVLCTAVAGGNVYMWDPENDELTDLSGLSGLLTVR